MARNDTDKKRNGGMSSSNGQISATLLSLSGAALVLLGDNNSASAATLDERTNSSYRFSKYTEGQTEGLDRYDISIHQFKLSTPVAGKYSIDVNVILETMSGASPWYSLPDANGKAVQIMSGATIEEDRQDINISVSRIVEDWSVSLGTGNSKENDYDAKYFKLSAERELYDKHLSLFGGLSTSSDSIHPTDAELFGRVKKESKSSNSSYFGFSRVINSKFLLSGSLSYAKLSGFLSDPYKQVRTLDAANNPVIINDSRPSSKQQYALSTKLRYHLGNKTSAHLDYRFYKDDWEIRSHTISTTIYKNFTRNLLVSQEFRYYNQSKAYFYAPYYNGTRSDGYYSSDYRLSPYGAISGRFKISYLYNNSKINFSLERYRADGSYAMKTVTIENPGLVNFVVATIGLDMKF